MTRSLLTFFILLSSTAQAQTIAVVDAREGKVVVALHVGW